MVQEGRHSYGSEAGRREFHLRSRQIFFILIGPGLGAGVVCRDVCLEMFLIWRAPIMITHCRTHRDGYRDTDNDVHADCVNYSYQRGAAASQL